MSHLLRCWVCCSGLYWYCLEYGLYQKLVSVCMSVLIWGWLQQLLILPEIYYQLSTKYFDIYWRCRTPDFINPGANCFTPNTKIETRTIPPNEVALFKTIGYFSMHSDQTFVNSLHQACVYNLVFLRTWERHYLIHITVKNLLMPNWPIQFENFQRKLPMPKMLTKYKSGEAINQPGHGRVRSLAFLWYWNIIFFPFTTEITSTAQQLNWFLTILSLLTVEIKKQLR